MQKGSQNYIFVKSELHISLFIICKREVKATYFKGLGSQSYILCEVKATYFVKSELHIYPQKGSQNYYT
jgi:hypothetical protein